MDGVGELLMPNLLGNVTFINNLLVSLGVALSILPQLLQNGNSPLGSIPSPVLPPFLGGPGHDEYPWGNRSAKNTNPYKDVPNTGVTRFYDLTISRETIAPDGYEKPSLLVNGQFPGPLLEANWGDYFHITVRNNITGPEEGTALHWHGLTQKGTPWYDGVPSVQQCPIAPGQSLVYEFQADLYGSSWYHSHYSAQYAGGLLGPMVIHGPRNAEYDIDLGPVLISDYWHDDYYHIIEQVTSNNPVEAALTTSDNTLIQGKMRVDCNQVKNKTRACTSEASIAKFNFTRGKIHRLRLINTSASGYMLFSIDSHELTVIANDFVPVKPYTVNQVLLGIGQRIDVLVTANAKPGAYWMRTRQPPLCALAFQPFALAAVYYDGVDTNSTPGSLPYAEFVEPTLIHCASDPLADTEPYYPIPVEKPDTTIKIEITQTVNSTGHTLYLINGQTFRGNYNHPLLSLANEGNVTYPLDPEWNVFNFGSNKTIRIILQNNLPFYHPWHVHGQNMQILDEGVGSWDGKTIIRPENPARRDTQLIQPNGYMVVQLTSDNPGVWPFHCHIAWHLSQGLYLNIMQQPGKIEDYHELQDIVKQSCYSWNQYTDVNRSEQIDSGL